MSVEANMRTVVFMFRRDRSSRLTAKSHGRGPDEMLYGLLHFDPSKYETSYVEGDRQERGLLDRLWYPIEAGVALLTGMGFKLELIVRNWTTLASADAIVVTTDTCGLPVAMCKALRMWRVPTVYVSQGLADRVRKLPWFVRILVRATYGAFLRAVDRIVVLGAGAAESLRDEFGLKEQEIVVVPFGIDEDFWVPGEQGNETDFVLSVGSDPARDYVTLLRAWSGGDLQIVTRQRIPSELLKNGVTIDSDYDDLQLRDLYQRSRFVITPLVNVTQPSGQSATLQAMACAKAVILTRTAGLWDPEVLRHMENCYLVEPGDVEGLREGVEFLKHHPDVARRLGAAARLMVEERWTSSKFAMRMEEQVELALQAQRANPA